MNPIRVCDLRASALLLFAALSAMVPGTLQGQVATPVDTGIRYAGNSTGTNIFSGDSGTANSTALNTPSYSVLDASGNLFLSDTANNCVRKVDTAGNITTVAGLRVNGGPDTCNTSLNPTPAPAEGLYKPTGLAIDSAGTLYISDSLHNCVRSLASGAVDSFAANALSTVAGTCTATDTSSVTPVPDGLAVDSANNLYISIRDSAGSTPVNQVLLHTFGASATSVCYLAGQPSASVTTACSGLTGTATLSKPGGLAIDLVGNLFIADTGNSCVREIAGLTTIRTAVGTCTNDASVGAGSLQSPSGLAITPANTLLISQSAALQNSVVSFSAASGTLTLLAGLPNGTPGPYSSLLDGESALSTPLNAPLGITTDALGNIYLADSANNVVRRFSNNVNFGSVAIGATSATQVVTFAINSAGNFTTSIGADYSITANTCAGAQTPASPGQSPTTCQVTVAFSPTRPGARNSALRLISGGAQISVALNGTAIGPLSLLTPGLTSTLAANLRAPIAVSVDSSGDAYVLEQGDAASTADVLFYPAGGGAPSVVVPQGVGLSTPTAMTVDAAGNIFIAEASLNTISRFGADGSVNISYVTGVPSVSALTVDTFDNLYVAQAGSVHTVSEIYANGSSRVIAGSGATAHADGVAASSALFVKPTGLALGINNTLAIADGSDQYVYSVDSNGTIHIVAGNGTSSSTNITQATGTAILNPNGLAYDAAGDLYISDQSANLVYEVFPVQSSGSNISVAVGTGLSGYSGDGGSAALATLNGPFTIALDGSANLFIVDYGNNALREVRYPTSSTLDFGHVVIGNSPTKIQTLANAGNAALSITGAYTPSDPHFSTTGAATTCTLALTTGGFCNIGYTFTPTVQGQVTATSTVTSNAYDTPQVVNLNAFGIVTQALPYTLPPETEVYGAAFTQSVSLNFTYPDLPPTGTMSFSISGNQTCSKSATTANPFGTTINCNAADSFLHVLQSPYTVIFTYTSGDIDYASTTGTTTLTVTPAPLTVTSPNITVPYGTNFSFPIPAATLTTQFNGDQFIPTDSTTGSRTSPPGTYPITTTLTPAGGASTSDYNITYIPGVLTITQAALSVTPANVSRQYGLANPTFTGAVVGTQNSDTFTVTYSTTATPASPVGTYPITATITGTNIADYVVTQNVGTLSVTPAPLTVNVASASRPYGTANPTFTSSIASPVYNGDTFTQNITTAGVQYSPVGTYPITDSVTGAAASNYTITVNPGTLTVTQATAVVTLVANNASRAYGAANPTFTSTVSGALNGDTFTITYTTPATATSPIGTYPVVPAASGPNAANYTFTVTNGTLTINAATLNITANDANRPYNTPNPAFTSTPTGLVNGDTLTITYATPATTTSPVGQYPIVPTVTGAALSNYTLTTNNGTLTVTTSSASPLVVTVSNATRQYGTANPAFSGTTTGLLNGDTVTVSYSTTATVSSPVGNYPITATVSGAAAPNYILNVNAGTLSITAAPLTVSANSASRAYGVANPVFTGTISGLLNSDTVAVAYNTTATTASPVGTYPIVPAVSGPAAGNYTLTANNGTLTITQASGTPLTVTVNNLSRLYGAANPALTGTVTGLLHGDIVTVAYSTTATPASPVGTYPITASISGAAAANYTQNIVAGALTVAKAPLTVTADNTSRAYAAANPTFTGTTTGLVNGDTVAIAYNTTATNASPVGTYPIVPAVTGAALTNYTLAVVPATLTVTQGASTVSLASSGSPASYGASVTFTATVSSSAGTPTGTVTFLNGTTVLGTGTVGANGVATYSTSSLAPGSLSITASYAGDTNFAPSSTKFTQVISAGTFSLAATPASQFVRGAGSTVFTITATSAQGFTGPVTLSCAGLPSDASCTFATPTITLAANGTATTTMTVKNTAADAKLEAPQLPRNNNYGRFAPVAFAAVFPFELTGLSFLVAGTRRKRNPAARSPKLRLMLVLLCTAGLMGLAGCACFTSVFQNYTVNVTGTTTVPGVASQSTSVILSVGQQ